MRDFLFIDMAQTPKLTAVLQAKCPKCRRGKIFNGKIYTLGSQKMNEVCPNCGFRFEIEPGYFYAAMYVSYAINVAIGVTIGLATFIITKKEEPLIYIFTILIACFLVSPFNYRFSRIVLLHYLSPKIKYDSFLDHD